jgi:hypothetical protein
MKQETLNGSEQLQGMNVLEMLTVANEYCLFLEKCEDYTREDVIGYLQKISPLLYLKGTLVPVVAVHHPEANERFVTEEQWGYIYNTLLNKFGEEDKYLIIDHADKTNPEMKKASMADNFADIYQDLKDFVMLYQRNTLAAKENAVNECRRLFETHWGFRLVSAHLHLHFLLFSESGEEQNTAFTF